MTETPEFVDVATGEIVEFDGAEVAHLEEADKLRNELASLSQGQSALYTSLKADTFEERLELVGAVTGATKVEDVLNVPIKLKHIVIEAVQLTDMVSGQPITRPRTVLVAEDGTAYWAISNGLYKAVVQWIGLVGEPHTWTKPLDVVVRREGVVPRQYFTMKLAPKTKK